MKKRGISAIVATVLIILITVAAISIIWAVILPMITNSLTKGQVCLEVSSNLYIKEGKFTCKNSSGASVQIARSSGEFKVSNISLIFTKDGSSIKKDIQKNSPKGFPGINEERTYFIKDASLSKATEVTISPTVTTKEGLITCDAPRPTQLPDC